MTWSYWIDKIKEDIHKQLGLNVKINIHLDESWGRIYYDKKLILLNVPTAFEALLTLLHEVGHYLSYLKYKDKIKTPSKKQREFLAYLYGRYYMERIGLDKYINHEQWKDFHREIFEQ